MRSASPLARTVDLASARGAGIADLGARFLPVAAAGLGRLPIGRQVFQGLPFDLGEGAGGRRWILVDRPLEIALDGQPASHVVVAHLCDTWRGTAGVRPAGIAVGHVIPVGEPLALYTITNEDGRSTSRVIRRRFEINDGILGWGSGAFRAIAHRENDVLDWRGPHALQGTGRYAAPGESGTLTIMPGAYGTSQTGMTDFVPSETDDALLWLHAIELEPGARPVSMRLESLSAGRPGSDTLVAAVSLFGGTDNPLTRGPRMQVRLASGPAGASAGPATLDGPSVDLGTIIRVRPGRAARVDEVIVGWGSPRSGPDDPPPDGAVIDLAVAPDAIVTFGAWRVPARELLAGAVAREPGGSRLVVALPPPVVPVEVAIVDLASGERIPGRVRFRAADGRYLPPTGHRDEINPGFFEDTGGDLILGSTEYAYVPGQFAIGLPVGSVEIEAVAGFDRRPYRATVDVDPATRRLELPLERTVDLHDRRWVTSDTHVHFLAPSTALLQAAAEDVDVVHVLAAQWGDLFTNVTDLEWGGLADPSGRRIVVVGTENRQNMLGHLALLGARRMTTPLASGGPPEGRMAGALDVLLADWADRCHAAGGLVVGAHFPLPYAEIAADIATGRIDAIETQALSPGLDDPAVFEWYRFLNLGYRLPIVAGTDKMSSEVPIGAVRAYVHLLAEGELSFAAWADAVRAGRTFVTSGPIIELRVDGHEPGDVIRLDAPIRLAVDVRVRAAQPLIGTVEIVVNGRVVASGEAAAEAGATELTLNERITFEAGSWVVARSRSRHVIQSAFTTSMAAHTSPVYVEVRDRPLEPATEDVAAVEQVMLGARTWVAELAAVAAPTERERMVGVLDASLNAFRRRMTAVRRPPA